MPHRGGSAGVAIYGGGFHLSAVAESLPAGGRCTRVELQARQIAGGVRTSAVSEVGVYTAEWSDQQASSKVEVPTCYALSKVAAGISASDRVPC